MKNPIAYAIGIFLLLALIVAVAGANSFSFGFLPLVAVPFSLQLWIGRKAKTTTSKTTINIIGWALLAISFYIYYDIFKLHPDPLSGVLLFFLPMFQLPVCLASFIAIKLIDNRNKKD